MWFWKKNRKSNTNEEVVTNKCKHCAEHENRQAEILQEVKKVKERVQEIDNTATLYEIAKGSIKNLLNIIKHANHNSLNEFCDTLYEKASKDKYNNSYADFTFNNIHYKNDLYVELLPYNYKNIDASSNSKLISDFNLKYADKVTIKEIKNIKISDVLIKVSPRGVDSTHFYNISFTVCYTNHLV